MKNGIHDKFASVIYKHLTALSYRQSQIDGKAHFKIIDIIWVKKRLDISLKNSFIICFQDLQRVQLGYFPFLP